MREASALPAPLQQPLLEKAELFSLLVAAADSIRGGVPRDLRLYLGDPKMVLRQTVEHLGAAYSGLLPRRADRTLAGYGERLRGKHGYPCFAIMLNDCQTLSAPLWSRVRDFVAGLIDEVGFPLGGVDANVFAGNYRRTPFGVHTDDRDVFTWIVEGKKSFLVWPWETLAPSRGPQAEAPRHPHDYADVRKQAQRLRGVAGDLLYWPREYWHVAEAGPEQLSATLSIGLDPRLPAQDWARELLGGLGAMAVGSPVEPDGRSARRSAPRTSSRPPLRARLREPARSRLSAAELPSDLARLAAAVAEGTMAQRFERDLRLRWMCWTTGVGLRTPPRAEVRPPRPTDRVRGDARWPIAWTRWNGQLLCSANGYALALRTSAPTSKDMELVLERLCSEHEILLRDLYSSLSRNTELAQIQTLLTTLLSCRAIEYVEP